ncbi:transposase, partial [Paenibacillus qinlingensis]
QDPKGNPVIIGTNLHWHSAEKIADIYKQRWQIEVFFRWIKRILIFQCYLERRKMPCMASCTRLYWYTYC